MTTYSYSTNEENFSGDFERPEDAAEECFINYSDFDTCYVGENRKFVAHDFIDTNYLLEKIADNAYDECGEAASEWLNKIMEDKAKRDELKSLIGDWLETNAPVTFYGVDNIVEYQRPPELEADEDDDGYVRIQR